MGKVESSVIESLETLGLTANEAKIFIYLAEYPNSNGYEISKNTGISRSLVYGALEKLKNNGILELTQTNSSSYNLKPIEEIKYIFEKGIDSAFKNLTEKLETIQPQSPDDLFVTIPERENQISKLNFLVKNTKSSIFISAGMKEIDWVKDELLRLPDTVQVHIFSLAKLSGLSERFNIYSKEMEMGFIQSMENLKDRWRILLIKDKAEMVLCGGDRMNTGVGIYTKNNMMVKFAVEHFVHDVKIYSIEKNNKIEDKTELRFASL